MLTAHEADEVLTDPVNGVIAALHSAHRKSDRAIGEEVGLSPGQVQRRRLAIAQANRVLLHEGSDLSIAIEDVRADQVARLEALYQLALRTWEESLETKSRPTSLDAERLGNIVAKFEPILMKLQGTEAPTRIEVEGVVTSPFEAEVVKALGPGGE